MIVIIVITVSVGPENVDIDKSEISFSVAIESMLQTLK